MDIDEFDIERNDDYERALYRDSYADAIDEIADNNAESVESKTVDTTITDERKMFIATIVSIECKQAAQFKAAIETLPKINGAMGQGKTNVRILKVLKETGILKETFKKKSVAQFSIADKREFAAAFDLCCANESSLAILKNQVLAPFNEAENEGDTTLTLSSNALVNKIALMAHLLIHPDAETYWTQLNADIPEEHRPAALDQQVPFRIAISHRLISIAHTIRGGLDYSLFGIDSIGEDAHRACSAISPATADFTNCEKELMSLKTKMVNLHDTLLQHLDASGGNLPIGCKERRILCWERFIGEPGRSKDVGLFYCFVLWEGKELRWTSRRLSPGQCVTSQSGDKTTSQPKDNTIFSKKEMKKVQMLSEAMNVGMGKSSDELDLTKKRVLTEQAQNFRAKRLQDAMDHPSFLEMSQERQNKIKEDYFSSLL